MGQKLRVATVFASLLLALIGVLVARTLQLRTEGRSNGSRGLNAAEFAGPAAACEAWTREDADRGERADVVASDIITAGTADSFAADARASLLVNSSVALTFRLRQYSRTGGAVVASPLYAQPPVSLQGLFPLHRVGILLAAPPPTSGVLLVAQSGRYNVSAGSGLWEWQSPSWSPSALLDGSSSTAAIAAVSGILFSTLAVHSAVDGACLWAHSFGDDEASGGPVLKCAGGTDTGADGSGLLVSRIVAGQTYAAVGNGMCASQVYVLGKQDIDVQLEGYRLEFPCGGGGSGGGGGSSLTREWTTTASSCSDTGDESIPCADWQSAAEVGLVNLVHWESGGMLFASYPLRSVDPWPNVTVPADGEDDPTPLSEITALNTTDNRIAWQLTRDVGALDAPVLAVVSNVVVSDTGTLFLAAVRNLTTAQTTTQWERVILSIDGATGSVLWATQTDIFAPFDEDSLIPGRPLELLQLAVTPSALVFCGLRPGNISDISPFGVGALDVAGGALLWRDSWYAAYPDAGDSGSSGRAFVPQKVAFCSSNLQVDDKQLYSVVAKRPTLYADGDSDVALEYTLQSRSVADGRMTWSSRLGAPPSAGLQDLPAPGTALAADYRSLLMPFTLAESADRGLVVQYDKENVDTRAPVSLTQQQEEEAVAGEEAEDSLQAAMRMLQISPGFLFTSPRIIQEYRCDVDDSGFEYVWVWLGVGAAASVLFMRCCMGTAWAAIRVRYVDAAQLLHKRLVQAARSAGAGGEGGRSKGEASSSRRRRSRSKESDSSRSSRSSHSSGSGGSSSSAGLSASSGGTPSTGGSSSGRSRSRSGSTASRSSRSSRSSSRAGTSRESSRQPLEDISASTNVFAFPPTPVGALASSGPELAVRASPAMQHRRRSNDASNSSRDSIRDSRRESRRERSASGAGAAPAASSSSISSSSAGSGRSSLAESVDPSYNEPLDMLCKLQPCSSGAGTGPVSRRWYSMRTGSPWVFLSLLHYALCLCVLTLSVLTALKSLRTLTSTLEDPNAFAAAYLINRGVATEALCRSQVAAACYCGSGIGNSTAAVCPLPDTCDFDVDPCARSCDVVLQETGNCAASLFQYTCTCGSNCAGSISQPNSTLRTDGAGGLPAGLQACKEHYTVLEALLLLSLTGYIVFMACSMWLHLHAAVLLQPVLRWLWTSLLYACGCGSFSNANNSGDVGGKYGSYRMAGGEGQSLLGPSGHGAVSAGAGAGAGAGVAMGSSASARTAAAAAQSTSGFGGMSVAASARNGSLPLLVYWMCCQGAMLLASAVWLLFLVAQGRRCTGSDQDATGSKPPLLSTSIAPNSSLILQPIPGCAFGSSWQDADVEGELISDTYRCLMAQVLAVTVLLADQITALLQACLFRCNVLTEAKQRSVGGVSGVSKQVSAVSAAHVLRSVRAACTNAICPQRTLDTSRMCMPEAWLTDCTQQRVEVWSRPLPAVAVMTGGVPSAYSDTGPTGAPKASNDNSSSSGGSKTATKPVNEQLPSSGSQGWSPSKASVGAASYLELAAAATPYTSDVQLQQEGKGSMVIDIVTPCCAVALCGYEGMDGSE